MKKLLFIFLFLFAVNNSLADQLAWLSKEQAEKTVQYIKDNKIKNVILWCACCDNDEKLKIKVTRVSYKAVEDQPYFEVWLEGKDKDGRRLKQAVDLAYVHIKKEGKWNALGKILEFECDPCTKPFTF